MQAAVHLFVQGLGALWLHFKFVGPSLDQTPHQVWIRHHVIANYRNDPLPFFEARKRKGGPGTNADTMGRSEETAFYGGGASSVQGTF